MNLVISDVVKTEIVSITPAERPIILTDSIPNPNWIAGFVSGDGNFDVRVINSSKK